MDIYLARDSLLPLFKLFLGLYSLASLKLSFVFEQLDICRGGFGGGGNERVVKTLSDFDMETVDEDRNKTVFKFEVLFIGNV